MTPSLIALDWGTSNLRASLLNAIGHSIEQRQSAMGVMKVPTGKFDAVLAELCGDWMQAHRLPLIASGMVGSRQGWKEAPYLECPATLRQAADCLTEVAFVHPVIGSAQGLYCARFEMRRCKRANRRHAGERPKFGERDYRPLSICVLPGTHSKWIWLDAAGDFQNFKTFMTGELYVTTDPTQYFGKIDGYIAIPCCFKS
jgi:2-dehydro-3-deoxygalactonokinase